VVFTAEDPEVIKIYVRKGMGIGIVASVACDPDQDTGLVAIDAAGLFPSCTTWIGFRRDRFLNNYMYSFLQLIVPGLDRDHIDLAISSTGEAGTHDDIEPVLCARAMAGC